jgi:hypothetical protein
MQGLTGVFAEWMQGRHLYVLGYLTSVFGNSVSMLIATLGLSGHSNGYWAIVAVAHNNVHMQLQHHDMKHKTLISFLQKSTLSPYTEKCMHIFSGLLASKIYLQPMFFHQFLRSNMVGLQQNGYEKVIGNGKKQSVQNAKDKITIFRSVDLHLQLMDASNMLENGSYQLVAAWVVVQTLNQITTPMKKH